MKVYISHPIAGRTQVEIRDSEAEGMAFALAKLHSSAWNVVLPRTIAPWCENSGDVCPPGRRIPGDKHTIPCYLRADFQELLKCTDIVMTKGWQTSYGAAAELQLAVQAGLRIHFL